jgi:hypothetical protein
MYSINNNKLELIDPKKFGLGPRTLIGKTKDGKIFLIKDRKSRIIMKDGKQILDQINMILEKHGSAHIALATNAPICSKTTKFFIELEIAVYQLEK